MVSYDEFAKLDLRVGKILECSRVEGSPKLLKLKVDFGPDGDGAVGERQILAGIGKKYEPEALVGKLATFIVNLEPRMLMGLESNGMIFAVSDDSGLSILSPDKDIKPGSKIS